jgi:predicted nucleic acid-binding protein
MKVLVDTPIWSLALRRRHDVRNTPAREELTALIEDGRVAMIGPIRQELLSGLKDRAQFERVSAHLRAFSDTEILTSDYEEAASFYNLCRARGIQGSNTDFLICAIAARNEFSIYTTDRDFHHFATVVPLALHAAGHTS